MYVRPGQNDREALLRAYFAQPPVPESTGSAVILMLLGLFMFLATLLAMKSIGSYLAIGILPSLVFVGWGLVVYLNTRSSFREKLREFRRLPPPPSDQEAQTLMEEAIQRLTEHSRLLLRLDELERGFSEPLRVQAPILRQTPGLDPRDLTWRIGNDGVMRFGISRIHIIWLTDRHLASYACYYDFIRGVAVNEEAAEIHYCDVSSFSTRETSSTGDRFSANLPTGRKATVQQELVLSTTSGDMVRVLLADAYIQELTGVEALPEAGGEKAIRVIRAMLRDKKRKDAEALFSSAA